MAHFLRKLDLFAKECVSYLQSRFTAPLFQLNTDRYHGVTHPLRTSQINHLKNDYGFPRSLSWSPQPFIRLLPSNNSFRMLFQFLLNNPLFSLHDRYAQPHSFNLKPRYPASPFPFLLKASAGRLNVFSHKTGWLNFNFMGPSYAAFSSLKTMMQPRHIQRFLETVERNAQKSNQENVTPHSARAINEITSFSRRGKSFQQHITKIRTHIRQLGQELLAPLNSSFKDFGYFLDRPNCDRRVQLSFYLYSSPAQELPDHLSNGRNIIHNNEEFIRDILNVAELHATHLLNIAALLRFLNISNIRNYCISIDHEFPTPQFIIKFGKGVDLETIRNGLTQAGLDSHHFELQEIWEWL